MVPILKLDPFTDGQLIMHTHKPDVLAHSDHRTRENCPIRWNMMFITVLPHEFPKSSTPEAALSADRQKKLAWLLSNHVLIITRNPSFKIKSMNCTQMMILTAKK